MSLRWQRLPPTTTTGNLNQTDPAIRRSGAKAYTWRPPAKHFHTTYPLVSSMITVRANGEGPLDSTVSQRWLWAAAERTAMSQALCSVEAASGGAVSAAWATGSVGVVEVTRSSAGGAGAAGGVGHEGRCLAWVAAYMLAERPVPDWASGRRVVAVGGQTERPVDDVGFVTDDGGWCMIQAKANLKVEASERSPLAKASGPVGGCGGGRCSGTAASDRPVAADRSTS